MNFVWGRKGSWSKPPPGSSKRTKPRNGKLCPALGFVCCMVFMYMAFGAVKLRTQEPRSSFVKRNGTHFMVDGRVFYVNGWNSYWLMDQAAEASSRSRVTEIFQTGARMGLTVCRTWAFNDGADHALQVSLGIFDERVFEALDWVIVEAQKHGIRLLLSLVNNLQLYGGKTQYVKWAREEGFGSSSTNDSFFFDPSIRSYFKIYLKTILTRKNHLTGTEYRDDPTIFAWELMNEPQCTSDASGDTLQEWIEEMAEYVKRIDKKHLLTVGLEGFYGAPSPPEKTKVNPGKSYGELGSDFLRNSKTPDIDFASAHINPDNWLMDANLTEKTDYVSKWVTSHIEDGEKELNKPVLFTEFGLSDKNKNFDHSHRATFYKSIYDTIYESALRNGAGAGTFIWHFLVGGMEKYTDDFGIIPGETPSIDRLIKEQSCRLITLQHGKDLPERSSTVC
ncbi:unnamed protein product [Musa acuminata subsp. malaccensis]|uniref:mannan endo-1,4-beta-mannosidase n=1 Tax=Musa acuminata subsp. malaccensis TaxID=214687 RepID=A0A804K902_MUSAM|nr:PREDICTED: mannan endo-1,4-beta-mannosidase 2-like [Musa acuminata subsp. malaccensis]CAG1832255.1 unnamed protein product [Musa acuminata subsp. malaccensis]